MNESFLEIQKVLKLMNVENNYRIEHGYEKSLFADDEIITTEGSELIINEALSNDAKRLFCIFLGPLTDMAIALNKCPEIENKVTVIWIGGGVWPNGGDEFNLSNDIIDKCIIKNNNSIPVINILNLINIIFSNNILNNRNIGISLTQDNRVSSYANKIYHNNFIHSSQHAYDECTNFWDDNVSMGNYWDNYTGLDINGDIIWDSSYYIPGGNNEDRFPLMSPYNIIIGKDYPGLQFLIP